MEAGREERSFPINQDNKKSVKNRFIKKEGPTMFLFSSSIFKPTDQTQEATTTVSPCKVLSQQKLQPYTFGFFQ